MALAADVSRPEKRSIVMAVIGIGCDLEAKAIGFYGRGENRGIGAPFDAKSEVCRTCGGCIYVCPACELRCTYTEPDKAICGGCANLTPPCVEKPQFDDMMCFLEPCVACEIKDR